MKPSLVIIRKKFTKRAKSISVKSKEPNWTQKPVYWKALIWRAPNHVQMPTTKKRQQSPIQKIFKKCQHKANARKNYARMSGRLQKKGKFAKMIQTIPQRMTKKKKKPRTEYSNMQKNVKICQYLFFFQSVCVAGSAVAFQELPCCWCQVWNQEVVKNLEPGKYIKR